MKYKAIAKTPFHNIGDIIDTKDYSWNPLFYPELFEPIKVESHVTEDGFKINTYDEVCIVTPNYNIRKNLYTTGLDEYVVFKEYKNAEDYIISKIDLKIENETIVAENIPLYSVCATSSWEINNSCTSLALFQRLHRTGKVSENWKYFRTEAERDWYIEEFRPIYSKNDIRNNNYKL